jgi:hypothetical protein
MSRKNLTRNVIDGLLSLATVAEAGDLRDHFGMGQETTAEEEETLANVERALAWIWSLQ